MSVNWNDKTTKEGLLKIFEMLSTDGVVMQNLFGFFPTDDAFFVVFEFNPGNYYRTEAAAERAKKRMLETLVSIEGVAVVCDFPLSPASP